MFRLHAAPASRLAVELESQAARRRCVSGDGAAAGAEIAHKKRATCVSTARSGARAEKRTFALRAAFVVGRKNVTPAGVAAVLYEFRGALYAVRAPREQGFNEYGARHDHQPGAAVKDVANDGEEIEEEFTNGWRGIIAWCYRNLDRNAVMCPRCRKSIVKNSFGKIRR